MIKADQAGPLAEDFRLFLDREEEPDFDKLHGRAESFIRSFKWCAGLLSMRVAVFHPGIVAVFLAEITPRGEGVDSEIWIVVGDLPPAYFAGPEVDSATTALDAYILEMELWVYAVERGQPLDDIIPVKAEPTLEHARMLKGRLEFLRERILPLHQNGYTEEE